MSFRIVEAAKGAPAGEFSAEDLASMQMAFDIASARARIGGAAPIERQRLARAVFLAYQAGERDPERLVAAAIEAWRQR